MPSSSTDQIEHVDGGGTARRKTDSQQNSLEQIQGILFGEKMDEIDERLSKLESWVQSRLDKLSRDVNSQISALRDEVKNKTDRLHEGNLELGRSLANVDGALLDQHKQLTVQVASATQEVADEMRRAITDLDSRKVDSALLSAFLTETAKNISPTN